MGWLKSSLQGARSSDRRIPLARTEDLAVEEFEDELLVYDRNEQRAHCLGVTAARVWRACDGRADVGSLADALNLSRDTVLRALDELEAAQLLDGPEVQVVDGNGDRNGITRRQLTKVGGAAFAGPLIYSIAVRTPVAAASPTDFACAVYSVSGCGTSIGAGAIAGCCCCCTGCSNSACQVGAPVGICPTDIDCPPNCRPGGGGTGGRCTAGPGTTPPGPGGCCSQAGASNCGCAFSDSAGTGNAGNTCNGPGSSHPGCVFPCSDGAQNCGAGCCDTSAGGPGPFPACTPGASNCVPCCNGFPIPETAPFGCCTPGTTNTCATP